MHNQVDNYKMTMSVRLENDQQTVSTMVDQRRNSKRTTTEDRTSYLSTLMHMLNGFIGSGILSMPITFKNGGLIVAMVMNPMIGILSCHCIHMLIQINELAMKIKDRTIPLDYHEVCVENIVCFFLF